MQEAGTSVELAIKLQLLKSFCRADSSLAKQQATMASLITQVNSTQATTTTWVEEGPKDPFVDDPYWDENGKSKPSNPLKDVLVQLQVAQARVGGAGCRLQVRRQCEVRFWQ